MKIITFCVKYALYCVSLLVLTMMRVEITYLHVKQRTGPNEISPLFYTLWSVIPVSFLETAPFSTFQFCCHASLQRLKIPGFLSYKTKTRILNKRRQCADFWFTMSLFLYIHANGQQIFSLNFRFLVWLFGLGFFPDK